MLDERHVPVFMAPYLSVRSQKGHMTHVTIPLTLAPTQQKYFFWCAYLDTYASSSGTVKTVYSFRELRARQTAIGGAFQQSQFVDITSFHKQSKRAKRLTNSTAIQFFCGYNMKFTLAIVSAIAALHTALADQHAQHFGNACFKPDDGEYDFSNCNATVVLRVTLEPTDGSTVTSQKAKHCLDNLAETEGQYTFLRADTDIPKSEDNRVLIYSLGASIDLDGSTNYLTPIVDDSPGYLSFQLEHQRMVPSSSNVTDDAYGLDLEYLATVGSGMDHTVELPKLGSLRDVLLDKLIDPTATAIFGVGVGGCNFGTLDVGGKEWCAPQLKDYAESATHNVLRVTAQVTGIVAHLSVMNKIEEDICKGLSVKVDSMNIDLEEDPSPGAYSPTGAQDAAVNAIQTVAFSSIKDSSGIDGIRVGRTNQSIPNCDPKTQTLLGGVCATGTDVSKAFYEVCSVELAEGPVEARNLLEYPRISDFPHDTTQLECKVVPTSAPVDPPPPPTRAPTTGTFYEPNYCKRCEDIGPDQCRDPSVEHRCSLKKYRRAREMRGPAGFLF